MYKYRNCKEMFKRKYTWCNFLQEYTHTWSKILCCVSTVKLWEFSQKALLVQSKYWTFYSVILWYFGVLCLKVAYCKYDAAFVHRSRLDVQIWNIVDYCIPSCSELRHELNRMCTFYCGISASLLFLGKILQLLQYFFFISRFHQEDNQGSYQRRNRNCKRWRRKEHRLWSWKPKLVQ